MLIDHPTNVNISPLSHVYTVQETTDSVGPIYCTADCRPECTITWNGPNISDGTTSVLDLQNINRNQAGDYRCMATNIIGSEMSIIVNIMVNCKYYISTCHNTLEHNLITVVINIVLSTFIYVKINVDHCKYF